MLTQRLFACSSSLEEVKISLLKERIQSREHEKVEGGGGGLQNEMSALQC